MYFCRTVLKKTDILKLGGRYFKWFRRTVRPVRWPLVCSILLHILLVGCSLAYVFVSKKLVDVATGSQVMAIGVKKGLLLLGSIFIGIIILRDAIHGTKIYLQTKAAAKMKNALRQRQFDNMLRLDGDIRRHYHSGDVLNRIEEDVNVIGGTCCSSIPDLVGTGLQFVAAFIYLLCIQPMLAWILVVILPAGIFGGRYLMRRIRTLTHDVRSGDSAVQSHIQESIQHQTLIKTLEYDSTSSATLENLQGGLYSKVMRRTRFGIWARLIIGLTMALSYALAFLWGIAGIYKGFVTYGLMTAFLQLVGQLQRPLMQMSEQLPAIFNCTASIDRLEELDQMPKEKVEDPVFIDGIAGIRIDDVTFKYDDGNENVLEHFSHDFKPGSRTAIVGPTGVGKSTLIKLMLALQKPTSGKIEFYGTSSEKTAAASPATRCNLVYVPQGNSLFSGTVRQNLLMGNCEADEEQMKAALHTAAADFVLDMEEGLDSQSFEAGGGLSEGQAQRIAIARALLRPGSILLLDEFSSALDPKTENTLLERLTARQNGKTMIFITHRERIADFCDEILRIGPDK